MKQKFFLVLTFAAVFSMASRCAGNVLIINNGVPEVSIVTTPVPSSTEQHAARELAEFLDKVTSCGKIDIGQSAVPGKCPIRFVRTTAGEIQPEGFALEVSANEIKILAPGDIGFLYGAYEIVKRYAGIRFLLPGDEGIYFTPKKQIVIEKGRKVYNPSFAIRSGNNLAGSAIGRDWMVRNNMRIICPAAGSRKYDGYAPLLVEGWQCYWRLLSGLSVDIHDRKQAVAVLDRMFEEHPEYFPLVDGKRMPIVTPTGSPLRQFCTTHPDVIRIVAENLAKSVSRHVPDITKGFFWLAPNDVTVWCECENCRGVDSPEDKLLHSRGTRVWHFANAVTRKAKQENPNCVIYGMAYQNFQAPPTAVKIEPDLNVFLAFNRRCWRHAIDDPGCLTNIVYNSHYKAWAAQKTPAICWEQVDHAGARFLPIEREVAHTLKYYKSLGNVNGSYPEVFAPGMKLNRQKYSKMSLEAWLGMWQAMYIFAAFQWDIDLDYEKTLEEINSLYYGYGWQGGMKEFRKLMEKTSIETPGCFGHGHSAPLGRLLSSPEVYHKLLGYLDAAEKAAVQDPDKRALMHVQRDREYFALTWEKALKEYQESYRELHLYRAEAQPLIDGILDDAVWKDADTLSNFRNIKSQVPIAQTIVKASYDDENLYIGIEALEPQMDDIVANIKTDDGEIWLDNAVEIFINVPMQEEQYYQIIVNALGTKYDHSVNGAATDLAFDMGKARAVKKYEDRWILECAIPFKTLGAIPRDGENWRLTFQRARILNNGVREISTPNGWRSHSVYSFLNTIFSGKRAVNIASGAEIVKAFWQNPSFDSVYIPKKPVPKWEVKDGIVPKNWILSGTTYKGITPKLEMAKDENGNSYARIGNFSTIFQKWTGPRGKFTVRFRAKGTGKLDVMSFEKQTKMLGVINPDPEKWQTFILKHEVPEEEKRLFFAFRAQTDSYIDLDDVFVDVEMQNTR